MEGERGRLLPSRFDRSQIRALVVVVSVLASAVIGIRPVAAGAARDQAVARYQVTALAGDPSFLVYRQYRLKQGRRVTPGNLYALDRGGTRTLLGQVGPRDIEFSLSGHTLEYLINTQQPSGGPTVELIDLATGTKTTLSVAQAGPAASPVGAAPNGVAVAVVAATSPHHLVLKKETANGTVSALGNPFPDGQFFAVTVNAHVYVAAADGDDGDGVIRTVRFSHPNQVHTLLGPRLQTSYCGTPTARYVACRTDPTDSRQPGTLRLFKITGGVISHTTKHCPAGSAIPAAALGDTAVWLGCPKDRRLWQLAPNGTITGSAGTFAATPPINALHEIVLSSRSHSTLIALTSATGKPHILAGAN